MEAAHWNEKQRKKNPKIKKIVNCEFETEECRGGCLIGIGIGDEKDLEGVGKDDPPILPGVRSSLHYLHFFFPNRHLWWSESQLRSALKDLKRLLRNKYWLKKKEETERESERFRFWYIDRYKTIEAK